MRGGPILSLRVPATSANLGSGFDTLGMALSLYNVFTVRELLPEGRFTCKVSGEGAQELSDPAANMAVESYRRACSEWGIPVRGLALECENAIPLCRGLGSSSTAVVAGVMLADAVFGRNTGEDELLRVMTRIEGHPDNVVPCFLGGMTVSCWDGESLRYVRLPPLPEDIRVVAAVPDVRVRTHDARHALPSQVRFEDAVFNLGRSALLCAAWATERWDLLSWGMDDRLHQPYRSALFPGGKAMLSGIRELPGCLAVAVSGSGSTMIALVRGPTDAIASAMCRTFADHGVASRALVLQGLPTGAVLEGASLIQDI